jgi:hypothetical protein
MGHYCRICDLVRPNEQFSGKGHKIHVCKRCKARPKSARQAIEDTDDFFGFLKRSQDVCVQGTRVFWFYTA